jgi:uncharacterized OB-fold protein
MPELPLPVPSEDNQTFWDYLNQGELRIVRCAACGTMRHPPRPMCAECQSYEVEWVRVSGRGSVYSYIITHQPIHPALVDKVPFATVIVELEEGPRLTTNLVDVAPAEITIGMPVEVVFQHMNDQITLPLFRRAATTARRD